MAVYVTENSNRVLMRYVLFFCWPILGVINAISCFGQKGTRTIITLFGFIWGLSFDYTDTLSDSSSYAMWFTSYFDLGITDLIEILKHYGKEGYNDIYTIVTFFGVSRITHNTSILFGIWGVVYFYFYSSCIYEIFNYCKENGLQLNLVTRIFFVGFILLLPLNAINGVRMWTAFMVFFAFSLRAILRNKPKALIYASCSILVHFSFLFPVLTLLFFWKFKHQAIIFYTMVILSFIGSTFVPQWIESYGGFFTSGVEAKLGAYSNADYVARGIVSRSAQVWYAQYRQPLLMYYLFGALFLTYTFINKRTYMVKIRSMFFFALSLLSLFNLTANISGEGRFFLIFAFSAFAFLTLFAANNNYSRFFRQYAYIGIIPIGIWIAVGQVNALRAFDLFIAFGNIITIPLTLLSQ